jgi:hypothetical protein
VPSVGVLYPDGVIHFQQDHSSIHNSCVPRMANIADQCCTYWLATKSAWYKSQEYVECSEENHARILPWPPSEK